MKVIIVPNSDGSFDLFEKTPMNRLEFISNHDNKEEAIAEKESLTKPMNKAEALKFIRNMKHSLTKI